MNLRSYSVHILPDSLDLTDGKDCFLQKRLKKHRMNCRYQKMKHSYLEMNTCFPRSEDCLFEMAMNWRKGLGLYSKETLDQNAG